MSIAAIRQLMDDAEECTQSETPDETAAKHATVEDFYAYLPNHQYIFRPTRDLWPASSVNSHIPPPEFVDGKPVSAATWLDQHRAVQQMTWAPGEPEVIQDRLVSNGGWITRPGCCCYNAYIAPVVVDGDPSKAGPWLEHVHRVFPEDAPHILFWLAHRVQKPQEKINHGLVLVGKQGVGKDTLLEPVKYAVGPWNFSEISPTHLLGRFNGFSKSVILRISEARDLGDVDRFKLYDHTKTYMAAPPDVIRVDEKNIREYAVLNVCGVIVTTNYLSDGIYLPADDRRHYVAASPCERVDFSPEYWNQIYCWFQAGGNAHVAAYLRHLDISRFDPKAPPPKTAAFWSIVDGNRAPEDAELRDRLEDLGNPKAVTLARLSAGASQSLSDWLTDRRHRRQIPHRLEAAGYTNVRNPDANDGLWKILGKRQAIYAQTSLSLRDQLAAATALTK